MHVGYQCDWLGNGRFGLSTNAECSDYFQVCLDEFSLRLVVSVQRQADKFGTTVTT